jgi:preprotein translocase subunit SecF
MMALIALYFFGGEVIRGFTFAMLFGVVVGTYSSVFIAAPFLILIGVKRDWSGLEKAKTAKRAEGRAASAAAAMRSEPLDEDEPLADLDSAEKAPATQAQASRAAFASVQARKSNAQQRTPPGKGKGQAKARGSRSKRRG